MIQVNNISLHFGSQVVFDNVSCTVGATQRVGLVGRNGAGKSTLLKIIAGMVKLDSGNISIERGKRIAYMPQEVILSSTKTVFDEAYDVFAEFLLLEQERTQIEELLPTNPDNIDELVERYQIVLNALEHFDRANALNRTHQILDGLGFSAAQKEGMVEHLSVGWKMRIVLAKLLLQDADFYLFDEPTNHLDIVAREWFFDFLTNARFGFMIVSHDRYYLDKGCSFIFELERGQGTWYGGNFTSYLEQKEEKRLAMQAAYVRQQKEIARKQATIDRFRASASRASMAQSMIKQLEKMELVEIEPPLPTVKFTFPAVERSGKIVLSVYDVDKSFDGKTVFDHASCEIERGEKVALVAANGKGKTTLFNLISGKYPLEHGEVHFGYNVKTAIFEQDQTRVLNPNKTVFDEVSDSVRTISEQTIRSFLGAFLFGTDEIKKKTSVLSGGERNRVAMVKVLLQRANFLLLDEPTNHLDLYAKDVLLQALQAYEGTMLFVSHDHDFISKLATRILELTPHGLVSYPGDYETYLWRKKNEPAVAVQQPARVPRPEPMPKAEKSSKDQFVLRKELAQLEQKIERLEAAMAAAAQELETAAYGTPAYQAILTAMQEHEQQLKAASARWEVVAQQLEA